MRALCLDFRVVAGSRVYCAGDPGGVATGWGVALHFPCAGFDIKGSDHPAVTKLCKDRTSQLNATRRELSTLAPMPRHGGAGAKR